MKSIIVTGAAGFIGSHVAEQLLKRGDTVLGLDNLNDYYNVENKKRNLKELEAYPNFSFLKCELENYEEVKKAFSDFKPQRIAHLAARAGVRPSIENPFIYESSNVKATLNLLDLARDFEVENFVLTSSSSVYGNSKEIPFREDDSATDLPISPYAATKKSTEVIGHTYHHLYQLNVNVIRPFTVYGSRGRPDMAPWLFLEHALKGLPIKKFGDGTSRRDYTFIGDFVQGFVAAIDKPFGYEIFNLGNSDTVSLNEAIAIVEKVSGKKLVIEQYPMQAGDVEMTYADVSKAREKLGYNPSTSYEKGMEKFNSWFVAQYPELQ